MHRRSQVDIWAMSDLCTPWCVHVVATLRIADHIATGITQIDDLAAASGSDSDSLHRVLRHLVGKDVFEDPAPGRFALNQTAHGLLNSPVRLGLGLDGIGGRMAFAWGSLLGAVRTGAGLSRGLPPSFLEGSADPSGSSCELRCVDGAGWARHSRPGGAGRRQLGIGAHRGRRRRRDGIAAGGNPSRPAQRAGARWSISRRP